MLLAALPQFLFFGGGGLTFCRLQGCLEIQLQLHGPAPGGCPCSGWGVVGYVAGPEGGLSTLSGFWEGLGFNRSSRGAKAGLPQPRSVSEIASPSGPHPEGHLHSPGAVGCVHGPQGAVGCVMLSWGPPVLSKTESASWQQGLRSLHIWGFCNWGSRVHTL